MASYNFIDIAKKNPDNIVVLDYGSGNLTLLLADEVSFNTGNQWEAPLEGGIMNSLGGVTTAIRAGQQLLGGAQTDIKNFRETILYYNNSKSLDISLNCLLIASREDEDLNLNLKPLFDLTNPDFDASASFDITMKAPLNYSPDPKDPGGKIAIKIGRFFASTRVYVLESCTPTISKAKLPNGKPMYMSLQVSLKPFRILSNTEVKSFLI